MLLNILKPGMKHCLLPILFSAYSAGASSATITFNNTGGFGQVYYGSNTTYTESGFNVFIPNTSFLYLDRPTAGRGSPNPNGTDYAQIDGTGGITITAAGELPFSFSTLQGGSAQTFNIGNSNDTMTFVGHFAGSASTITYVQPFAAGTIWTNITLPSTWTNLSSVDIFVPPASFTSMYVDSIVVSAVPEPGTFAMMYVGLALVAPFLRRKRG